MRGRLFVRFGFVGVAFATRPALAAGQTDVPAPETHPCDAPTGATKLVCRAGYDALYAMIPLGGLAVGGGNPSLTGVGGGRKFGDLAVTLRANYVKAPLPSSSYDGVGDTVALAKNLSLIVPSVDLRMALLSRALPVGTVSVDFLGNVFGIPTHASDYIKFGSDVRTVAGVVVGFGYGLRIGFAPKAPMPTVSLNVAKHDLPNYTFGDLAAGSNFAYNMSVSTLTGRLMVGKQSGSIEFGGGGGVDLYNGSYSIRYRDLATGQPVARADSTRKTMRIVVLSNLGWHLGRAATLNFEGGFQVGKDDKLPTIFEGNNTKSGRFFGGVGIGFKL